MAAVNERHIQLAGRDIAYRQSAGTGRPVVFVHGNSASSRAWLPVLTGAFGERFRCLAFDLPGHGGSARPADPADYAVPAYASVLTDFIKEIGAQDAVVVGWSLGGHVVLEAAPALPGAAGFVIFGTPPVNGPADMATAFLPNPAMGIGFTAQVDAEAARTYAQNFLSPGSTLPTDAFVEDILATDGAAREGIFAAIGAGRFLDELEIVAGLKQPLAILQGEGEQLISLDYLRSLTIPTLWRGAVQVLPGLGHAAQVEGPEQFAEVLTAFIADLG
jgi:pimeloyl-ACP methyl ester carboxylesterase